MQCLWRTKESNLRKRCTRQTPFLLCWQHTWKPFPVIASIIIILGAISGFTGFNLRDLFSKSPVQPDITCSMEYPIKNVDDRVFREKQNPEIVISNNGPVKALSVSGQDWTYRYDSIKGKITGFAYSRMKSFDHAFSKEELRPFEEMRHSTFDMSGENILVIYVVRVVYHIGSEMEQFDFENRFFIENKEIKNDVQFSRDERYDSIIQKLADVDIAQWTVTKATAVAEHVWMLEPENYFSAKWRHDGKKVTIIGLPKDQGELKKDGYPFLKLKPYPFKATGFYTKAEIVADHVEVKTVFALTNTGDKAAMITEDGFEILETIEPSQTKYYTKTINVGRMEGNEGPLENFIKLIDKSENVFGIKFNINYRPANDYEKLIKVTGHYFVGKHKVTKIKHNTRVKTP